MGEPTDLDALEAMLPWLGTADMVETVKAAAAELRSLRAVLEAADDELFTECWAPVTQMADIGGHLREDDPCGSCAACRLADAIASAPSLPGEENDG